MLIRAASAADLPLMRALEQQAVTAAHWGERDYAALFSPDAPQRLALLAESDSGQVFGFAIARCSPGEWEIENVVVAVEHRRRGIGRALVQELLQAARAGGAAVLLEVRESNSAARQLYEALGFAQVGRRVGYYRDPPEDALLLRFPAQIS
ncbi:MAG TPA: ribosomal protein S18-alanine N-acetyltransferase [Terriglobales bacterium]|nr:ribosomal protein S18-alanine N-acetyltransferase [Terriglobales bacterium]